MSETVLYRVVEKRFNATHTRFLNEGGLWYASLESARAEAERNKAVTLAHRLFVVSSTSKGKSKVVEEVSLAPLLERMARIHQSVLAARDPERLAREKLANGMLATWHSTVPDFPVLY